MGINVITAADTFTVFDRVLNDLADGDASTITFSNDIVGVKTGKNRNTIFSPNETGNNAAITLRVMRGSSDDRFLENKFSEWQQDPATFALATGEFVKRLGDGQGNVIRDVYNLAGGVFSRKVDGKQNVEGDTEQGVAVFNMIFANVTRSAQ